jgi:FKBP-type peptidyl-prolyl cis-trans isomerase FkpA
MSTVTAVPLQPVKRSVLVYLWLGIALAVIAAVALAWQAPRDEGMVAIAKIARGDRSIQSTSSGLHYKVVKAGTGEAHPTDADVVLVNYEGKLLNGTTFDASQQPTPMRVAGVVPGFSEGLKLMTKGAKYRFWIRPSLGYGDKAPPGSTIPANSVLAFDVELLDWKSEAELRQMQQIQQMMQQQGGPQGGAPGGAVPPQGER